MYHPKCRRGLPVVYAFTQQLELYNELTNGWSEDDVLSSSAIAWGAVWRASGWARLAGQPSQRLTWLLRWRNRRFGWAAYKQIWSCCSYPSSGRTHPLSAPAAPLFSHLWRSTLTLTLPKMFPGSIQVPMSSLVQIGAAVCLAIGNIHTRTHTQWQI